MAVVVHLERANLALTPGDRASVDVRVRNSGTVVDEFAMVVVGDASAWATVDPATLSLFPGAEGTATITFSPPRTSSVRAGAMPFGLRVASREDPAASVVEEGTLDLAPFHEVSAELVPRTSRGSSGATHDLAVDNRGNLALEAALTALDPDRLLAFEFRPSVVLADPATAVFAKVRVRPRQRFWRGPSVSRPFQLQVIVADAPPVTLEGTLLQTAILPAWTVRALAAALAVLVIGIVLWATVLKPTIESTARAQAEDVLAAVGITPAPAGATAGAPASESPAASAGPSSTPAGSPGATMAPSAAPDAGDATLVDGRLLPGGTPFAAPADTTLYVTDLIFSNPSDALSGEIRLERAAAPLLVLRLENFRDLDFHFVTPIVIRGGQTLALVCDPGCDGAAIYYSGYQR